MLMKMSIMKDNTPMESERGMESIWIPKRNILEAFIIIYMKAKDSFY